MFFANAFCQLSFVEHFFDVLSNFVHLFSGPVKFNQSALQSLKTFMQRQFFVSVKNVLYKNIEAEISDILRIFRG